jgi:tetratricopeptide (TPR) repeat protein/transcriptional regulator with XRE-family HTH domain
MRMEPSKTTPQPRDVLADERIRRRWSQQEVADRIGTTFVNVSRWERGITRPNPYFRRKLCALYQKSAAVLGLEESAGQEEQQGESSALTRRAPFATPVSASAILDPAIPLESVVSLVGRKHELSQIKKRLYRWGNGALTALNGLPGVGKTALSIALAHDVDLQAHFRDGILWAGLGPSPNMLGHLSRWGTLLGVPSGDMPAPGSVEEWAKTLRAAIGSRFMLLVIDDAWKVEDVLALKVGGPNCAHLVTTRFPHIATHMTVDGAILVQELNEVEGMELLRKLAPSVVDREPKKAADLVQAVGGLPLALKLMGNYLRKEAYSGKGRRIGAALEYLARAEKRLRISEPDEPVEHHTSLAEHTSLSLQSVFAVTDQQLDDPARGALYALSVFPPKPNSFSEEAALAVADCTVETLDNLTDAGLLESAGSDRYTLHQTIADYARLHLKEESGAPDRLITYAFDYVEAHKKDYELLELESSIILAALEIASTTERWAKLVRGANAFAPFLLVRGFYPVAEEQLQRAQRAAEVLEDKRSLASTLLQLGEIAQKQGKYGQARTYYDQGLTLAREIQDPERISALLTNLGWLTLKQGECQLAGTYLQEGLTLGREINHIERISGLLEMLGSVASNLGNYAQSEAYLLEGLTLARQVGDRERICSLLINLGTTAGEQGNLEQALSYFLEGLELARQIGHREWMCFLLANLGYAVAQMGDFVQAEAYFQEGLTLARQIEHREAICGLFINLGIAKREQGNFAQAEACLQEGLTLAHQLERPEMTSYALYEYGNLCLNQQQIERAEASYREMLTFIPEGSHDHTALAHFGLARVASAQGELHKAQSLGEQSVTTLGAMGHRAAKEVRDWLKTITP